MKRRAAQKQAGTGEDSPNDAEDQDNMQPAHHKKQRTENPGPSQVWEGLPHFPCEHSGCCVHNSPVTFT